MLRICKAQNGIFALPSESMSWTIESGNVFMCRTNSLNSPQGLVRGQRESPVDRAVNLRPDSEIAGTPGYAAQAGADDAWFLLKRKEISSYPAGGLGASGNNGSGFFCFMNVLR